MKYSEKLRDPRWQKKRLKIMERDGFTCLCCGDSKSTLNVHHKQYSGNPWEADDEALETLCEPCHEKRSALNQRLMMMPTKFALEVLECSVGWLKCADDFIAAHPQEAKDYLLSQDYGDPYNEFKVTAQAAWLGTWISCVWEARAGHDN
jgi:hypothetical protein